MDMFLVHHSYVHETHENTKISHFRDNTLSKGSMQKIIKIVLILIASLAVIVIGLNGGLSWTSAKDSDANDVPLARELSLHPPAPAVVDLSKLMGTWYIVATNYDFWQARSYPTVTYQLISDETSVVKIFDRVAFQQNGEDKTLDGVDIQDPSFPSHFQWRGEGWLHIIRSQWFIVAVGPELDGDYTWVATWFADNMWGTGSGFDIYMRSPNTQQQELQKIIDGLRRDSFFAAQSKNAFMTDQGHGMIALN